MLTLAALSQLTACGKDDSAENFEVFSVGDRTTITKYRGTSLVVNIPSTIEYKEIKTIITSGKMVILNIFLKLFFSPTQDPIKIHKLFSVAISLIF